jgi:hypothetical protein
LYDQAPGDVKKLLIVFETLNKKEQDDLEKAKRASS